MGELCADKRGGMLPMPAKVEYAAAGLRRGTEANCTHRGFQPEREGKSCLSSHVGK